jgi:hypothetical protein
MAEISQFSAQQLLELYAMVLLLGGEADPALLSRLGLDADALNEQLAGGGAVADAARLIKLAGHTGNRRILALLLRGSLVDMLALVRKPAELRDLATATSRMPEWVFELPDLHPGTAAALLPSACRESAESAIGAAEQRLATETDDPGPHGTGSAPGGNAHGYAGDNGCSEPDPEDPHQPPRDPDDDFEQYLRGQEHDGAICGIEAPACRDGPAPGANG